jgi:CheY-like chemotaxis protein
MNAKYSILVMDDEPDIPPLVKKALEGHGYRVDTYVEGTTNSIKQEFDNISDKIRRFNPDAILSDYNYTRELTAFDIFRYLQEKGLLVNRPFIIWTKSQPDEYQNLKIKGQKLGIAAVLEKPEKTFLPHTPEAQTLTRTLEQVLHAK